MLKYILKKLKKYTCIYSVFILPDVITKSYPETIEDCIANAHKLAVNVGDKLEMENFKPTVANKSELEVCLYIYPKAKHF